MKPNTEKAMATKAAKKTAFDAQTIQIDDDWRIIRFDEFNWQIQKRKGEEWKPYRGDNYFGSVLSALKSLPATMLGDKAKNDLANIHRMGNAIQAKIETALNRLDKDPV